MAGQSDLLHIVSWEEPFLAMQPALPPAGVICGREELEVSSVHQRKSVCLLGIYLLFTLDILFASETWYCVALAVFKQAMHGAGGMA